MINNDNILKIGGKMLSKAPLSIVLATIIVIISLFKFSFAIDPLFFQENVENRSDQPVWTSMIDKLIISRGPAEFILIDGELTLFDFGSGIPCALVFDGEIEFNYSPPRPRWRDISLIVFMAKIRSN